MYFLFFGQFDGYGAKVVEEKMFKFIVFLLLPFKVGDVCLE